MQSLAIVVAGLAVAATANAQNIFFPHDGPDRQYRMHIADEFRESPPLVPALHGYGMSNILTMDYYGWTELADERGLIAAFPSGTLDRWSNPFGTSIMPFTTGLTSTTTAS